MSATAAGAFFSTRATRAHVSGVYVDEERPKTLDFRVGRYAKSGKWVLGRHEFETQDELLEAIQDALDELFGPEEYNALGNRKGIFQP